MFSARTRGASGCLAFAVALAGCIGNIGDADRAGSSKDGEPPTLKDGQGEPPTTRIRRLTKLDVIDSIEDLLPGKGALAADLEADARIRGFSTGAERSVTPGYADSLKRTAESIAADFKASIAEPAFDPSCFSSDEGAEACAKAFVTDFAARAFRRPLADEDVTALMAVYQVAREAGADGDAADRFEVGMDFTMRAIVQSPDFIYATELGDPAAPNGEITPLTPHEMATAIAFAVTASPPDDALRAAADANQLGTPEAIAAEVRRLAGARPDRTKAQLRRFVMEWLKIDFDKPDWSKSTEENPLFSTEVKGAIAEDTALFLDDWVDSGAAFDALLTSSSAFVNQTNAPVYGLGKSSSSFQKTDLDPAQRAGILTMPGFLGSSSHIDASSPTQRGLVIMDRLLCRIPPPVPAMVPPLPPKDTSGAKTTRDRYEAHENVPFCQSCHSQFDPMGFSFEMYDAMGVYRTTENGFPVDTTGALVGTTESDGPVANAVELTKKLAADGDVHACLSRQIFRYLTGRAEEDFDTVVLSKALDQFTAQELMLLDLISAIVASDSFAYHKVAIDP